MTLSSNFVLFAINIGYITKYKIIKAKEDSIINHLKKLGISVCRVTKPSKKPAIIKIGVVPINIFIPLRAFICKDCVRVNVLGNNNPFPNTIPAHPAITIAEISSAP